MREMPLLSPDTLEHYWTGSLLAVNGVIALNLIGALLLGMLVGYERSYNGRAAGMRTYGLVCMASTALTVFAGYSEFWYGGLSTPLAPDPTRVVQGIVTGIGFLCGGVIMRDGLSITGLTSAASLWAASAIGVLLGVGFYASALLLALLCTLSMSVLQNLERRLPARSTLGVSITFREGVTPTEDQVAAAAAKRGYVFMKGSLSITLENGQVNWKFSATASDNRRLAAPAQLAEELARFDGVASFNLTPARN